MNSHQPTISKPTASQNNRRRLFGLRPGRDAATPSTAPQAASSAARWDGELYASAPASTADA